MYFSHIYYSLCFAKSPYTPAAYMVWYGRYILNFVFVWHNFKSLRYFMVAHIIIFKTIIKNSTYSYDLQILMENHLGLRVDFKMALRMFNAIYFKFYWYTFSVWEVKSSKTTETFVQIVKINFAYFDYFIITYFTTF